MDIKIKLLKALATTNTPPSPPPKKNNVEVHVDHLWPWLNNFDQGGVRERAIVVPNPGEESEKFLTLFVQDGSYSLPKQQSVKLTFFALWVMSTFKQHFLILKGAQTQLSTEVTVKRGSTWSAFFYTNLLVIFSCIGLKFSGSNTALQPTNFVISRNSLMVNAT